MLGGRLPWLGILLLASLSWAAEESNATTLNETGHEAAHEDEHHEEESEPVFAVLMPWFVQAVGVLVYYLLTRYLHGLPYTAVLFIVGTAMGVGSARSGFDDQLTESIRAWVRIDHEVLFNVFLPGLLFKDALEINFYLFQASLGQLLILAFPAVLAGTLLTAAVVMFVLPYGWTFHQALCVGSILSATDPVAVAALLNEVGAPPRLKMHISGESLLNDGSAVVFFTVFSSLFLQELGIGLGEDLSVGDSVVVFLRMALGGAVVGTAFALGLIAVLHQLDRRLEREEMVLQVAATATTAYLAFYTAEVVCHMSGVISVVVLGILTKAFGSAFITDWDIMNSFWSLTEHLLNTVIFALGGIEFGSVIASVGIREWEARDWGYLIVLFIFLNVIRFFLIFAFYPIMARIGLGTNVAEATFSSFAGLRGAVGIALALALDNEIRETTDDPEILILPTKIFGFVGGIAFLTLTINAPLCGPLLSKLKLADSSDCRKEILKGVDKAIRRHLLDDFIVLMTDPRYHNVDFALVAHHVHQLQNLTAKELEGAIELNRNSVHPSVYRSPVLDYVLPHIPDAAGLRVAIEQTRRSMFLNPTDDKDAACFFDKMEEGIAEEEEAKGQPSEDVLINVRLMFIELLRASYQAQIRDGELDPREFNGFLAYILLQSLEFAHESTIKGEPLTDWDSARLVSTESMDKINDIGERLFALFLRCNGKTSTTTEIKSFRDLTRAGGEVQKGIRLDVLRAFSFIDAHKEAQDRLRDELGAEKGELGRAFEFVMRESRDEVRKATDVLRTKKKGLLRNIISHHLCIVLLNKSARYITLLMESGVLLQKEATHLREEIEESFAHIRSCQMEKHPGTLDLDVEIARDDRGRRRRIRQKSIL